MMGHDFKSNFSSFTPKISSQNRLYKNYFLWNLGEVNLPNVFNVFGKKTNLIQPLWIINHFWLVIIEQIKKYRKCPPLVLICTYTSTDDFTSV